MKDGFYDLRSALDCLDRKGELARVEGEVDWNLELGTLTREVYRRKGPALIFRNIKAYSGEGARCRELVTGVYASMRRVALMLGFDDAQSNRAMIEHVLERNRTLIKPMLVKDGPVKQHVLTGRDINLYDFPVPKWHREDGGRYINTFQATITKDPDTGVHNLGIYRGMIGQKDTLPVLLWRAQNWGVHFQKWAERGQKMPVAHVYGWEPTLGFCASAPIPTGVSEYEVMGAIRGEPVELVKCETSPELKSSDISRTGRGGMWISDVPRGGAPKRPHSAPRQVMVPSVR